MDAEVTLRMAAQQMRADWPLCTCGEEHDTPLEDYDRESGYHNAIADWLEAEAASLAAMAVFNHVASEVEQSVNIRGAALTVRRAETGAISLTADTSAPALAVARIYLGETP